MRLFHTQQIVKYNKKQQEEYDKLKNQSQIGDGKLARPNIDPSSVYNF